MPHSALRAAALCAAALSACAAPLPDPGLDTALQATTGADAPLPRRSDGEALDAPPAAGAPLTAPAALAHALQHDAAIQAAAADVDVALAEAEQARLWANPLLGVVGRWGNGPWAFEASVAAPIVQMLQSPRRASAADHRLRLAVNDALGVAADALANAQRRYVDAQAADVALALRQDELAVLDALLALADSRLRQGEGTQLARAQLAAERFAAEREQVAAARVRQAARLQLAHALGAPSHAADWPLDPWTPPTATVANEAAWTEAALRHRADLRALQCELEALGDEEALAVWWPWQGGTVGAETQRTPQWFTGPNATTPLPLFDRGQAEAKRARAEVVAARHRIVEQARVVVTETRLAHAAFAASAAEAAALRDVGVPACERRRDAARNAQRAGEADAEAALLAERELLAARRAAAVAEHAAALARIDLQRAAGGAAASTQTDSPARPAPEAQ